MILEPRSRSAASERGAILIQTGIMLLVVSAFAMFVVDYGVLWVSRHQAQNAADSGALAGATALAHDDFLDRTDTGPAKLAARQFALANYVFGAAPDVNMTTDVRFYADDNSAFPAMCSNDDCIRVDVYRNQTRYNPLPTFFGYLVGVDYQGVRAMAIAQAAGGNATTCLKPWAVIDKWSDSEGPWTVDSKYDPAVDTYIAPNGDDPGTSYTLDADLGLEIKLKVGPTSARDEFGAGWSAPVRFGDDSGGDDYREAISGCTSGTNKVGDTLRVENGSGKIGPTKQGVDDLVALDPTAEWDPIEKKVIKSRYAVSPRLVAVPIVDTQSVYEETDGGTQGAGGLNVRIVAILGFFVKGMDGNDVAGVFATKPDLLISNGGAVSPTAAFLMSVRLVR
jgi:Flp pilus assembly protein TadG